jgi:hypothetical protein
MVYFTYTFHYNEWYNFLGAILHPTLKYSEFKRKLFEPQQIQEVGIPADIYLKR